MLYIYIFIYVEIDKKFCKYFVYLKENQSFISGDILFSISNLLIQLLHSKVIVSHGYRVTQLSCHTVIVSHSYYVTLSSRPVSPVKQYLHQEIFCFIGNILLHSVLKLCRINSNISKYREFKESKVLVLATKSNITSK